MREVLVDISKGTFVPYPGGQAEFCFDWSTKFIGLEGGWFAGKTFIGARKLVAMHLYNAFGDNGDATYVSSALVAPTYGNAADFDIPELEKSLDECNLAHQLQTKPNMDMILPDLGTRARPSIIRIRTADTPDRITGWTVGVAWGDEAARWPRSDEDPKRDPFIQLCGRVRDPKAKARQLFFTYTNEGDNTRIFQEFHSGYGNHRLYRVRTSDNPVAKEFYEEQKLHLSADLMVQYLEGGVVSMSGTKVYSSFDRMVNIYEVSLSPNLPLQLGVDFNIAPGMHMELGQYDPLQDVFTTVHEIHRPRMDTRSAVAALARLLQELQWDYKSTPLELFGDATGTNEWAGTGESCYQILKQALDTYEIKYRIRVPRMNPPLIDRINACNVALKDVQGRVHWLIHPRCKRLLDDLEHMCRNKRGELNKDDMRLSHASDADGYRVCYLRPARVRVPDRMHQFGVNVDGQTVSQQKKPLRLGMFVN